MKGKSIISMLCVLFFGCSLFRLFSFFLRIEPKPNLHIKTIFQIFFWGRSHEIGLPILQTGWRWKNQNQWRMWSVYVEFLLERLAKGNDAHKGSSERKQRHFFVIDSIRTGKRSYSKNQISVTFHPSSEDKNPFPELTNWSSFLSKERDLSDEEIDARYCHGTIFTSEDLNLNIMWSKIEESSNRYWTILLNEDKTFEMEKADYEGKTRGTYNTTRAYLYLSFEEVELLAPLERSFPLRWLTVPFKRPLIKREL